MSILAQIVEPAMCNPRASSFLRPASFKGARALAYFAVAHRKHEFGVIVETLNCYWDDGAFERVSHARLRDDRAERDPTRRPGADAVWSRRDANQGFSDQHGPRHGCRAGVDADEVDDRALHP